MLSVDGAFVPLVHGQWAESEEFQRLTFGELHLRRVERAGQIARVSDGAEWIQHFIDFHAPTANRILDFYTPPNEFVRSAKRRWVQSTPACGLAESAAAPPQTPRPNRCDEESA